MKFETAFDTIQAQKRQECMRTGQQFLGDHINAVEGSLLAWNMIALANCELEDFAVLLKDNSIVSVSIEDVIERIALEKAEKARMMAGLVQPEPTPEPVVIETPAEVVEPTEQPEPTEPTEPVEPVKKAPKSKKAVDVSGQPAE